MIFPSFYVTDIAIWLRKPIIHVTSLDDDALAPQPGTFRYGISKVSGPRTIVFDVGGVIQLKGRLACSDPYVTIAGQTAPGNGIMDEK